MRRAVSFQRGGRERAAGRRELRGPRNRRRQRRGAVLVEAVLIIPVIVLLLLGFIQFSSMYFTRHAMVHAAREGARALSVQDATTAQAVQRTRDVLSRLGYDPDDFTVTGNETVTDGTITVTVPAVDASIIGDPFGFMGGGTLTTAAVMKDEEG